MSDHIYKTLERTGSSTSGIEDAVNKAAKTLHKLNWFEVSELRVNSTMTR